MNDERIPLIPPEIKKIADASHRPMWSVMIPVYNSIDFLEDALRSVLSQDLAPEEMQIEVIDDASTDGDVHSLVKRIGRGRVAYFRNSENRGSVRTFEVCINRSRGHYIHILHADDKVRDGYYREIADLFTNFPGAGAAFCRFDYIDEQGNTIKHQKEELNGIGLIENWLKKIGVNNRIQFVAVTVKRQVYEELGSFYGLNYGEDWVMWVKIASRYRVAYTDKPLASYRKHLHSITGRKILTGEYADDLRLAMKMNQEHLPVNIRRDLLLQSRRYYANYVLDMAYSLFVNGASLRSINASVRQATRFHVDGPLVKKVFLLYRQLVVRRLRS